jgi:uncharacterized protein
MPEPSPGDIWLDLEGHPWFEPARGLEYLLGLVYLDDGPQYDCLWAHGREAEKAAFERLIDLVSSSGGAASPACTSTTTRRTSALRLRG